MVTTLLCFMLNLKYRLSDYLTIVTKQNTILRILIYQ